MRCACLLAELVLGISLCLFGVNDRAPGRSVCSHALAEPEGDCDFPPRGQCATPVRPRPSSWTEWGAILRRAGAVARVLRYSPAGSHALATPMRCRPGGALPTRQGAAGVGVSALRIELSRKSPWD